MFLPMALRCRLPLLVVLLLKLAGPCEAGRATSNTEGSEGLPAWLENAVFRMLRPKEVEPPTGPVVWVPGITSSVLRARRVGKLGKAECEDMWSEKESATAKDSATAKASATARDFLKDHKELFDDGTDDGFFTLYNLADSAKLAVQNYECLNWGMTLQQLDNGCIGDAEGLEVRPKDVGGTQGALDGAGISIYFRVLRLLTDLGYVEGKSARFFFYDWRKYGDRCWEPVWFQLLKKLIEDTKKQNKRQKVTLACHSMGCPLLHLFLSLADPEWKRDFVKHMIALGPAFAGAVPTAQAFFEGPVAGYSFLVPAGAGREMMVSMPSFYTLLPTAGLGNAWHADDGRPDTLVTLVDDATRVERNFTAETIGQLLGAASESGLETPMNGFAREWLERAAALPAPGVPVTCMYIVDVPTAKRVVFHDLHGKASTVEYGEGDGTVNRESAEKPCRWFSKHQEQGVRLVPLSLGGPNHVSMLGSSLFLRALNEVLTDHIPLSKGVIADLDAAELQESRETYLSDAVIADLQAKAADGVQRAVSREEIEGSLAHEIRKERQEEETWQKGFEHK